MIWLALLTFVLSAAVDFLYVRFWQAVAKDEVWGAVFWSVSLAGVNMVSVYVVVWEPWTLPFTLLGHGLGCYLSMRFKSCHRTS